MYTCTFCVLLQASKHELLFVGHICRMAHFDQFSTCLGIWVQAKADDDTNGCLRIRPSHVPAFLSSLTCNL